MATIVTRTGKGSALTWEEADANFTNLNTDKLETGFPATQVANTPAGGIAATDVQAALNELDTEKIAFTRLDDSDGSSLVGFIQVGTGAVPLTAQSKMREVVSVKDFGASAVATAANNLIAFKAAVAATPTGGKLVIPVDSTFYTIDTSGGLTTSIEINKRMEVVFEGDVKSNYGTLQANPPFIFNVTANDVTFSGSGRIIGDGTVNDLNTGDDSTMPGLVRVTGDNFRFTGITIDTPPKVGISLYDCENATIESSHFTGGVTSYTVGNTAYFGIRVYLGKGHLIDGNQFYPNGSGGTFTNCIFTVTTTNNIFSNNIAIHPYEKLIYLYGSNNLITGNHVKGNPSTIPGTAQAGTITSVYRVIGANNTISNNTSDYCLAGLTVQDGAANVVIGNSFLSCGQLGIIVFPTGGYVGTFDQTVVSENCVSGAVISGITQTTGISIALDGASSTGIDVSNNKIYAFNAAGGTGALNFAAASPYSITNSTIQGNSIKAAAGTVNGIYTSRVTDSLISSNAIYSVTGYALVESGGAYNYWQDNKAYVVGTIGIQTIAATSTGKGNQYTRAVLSGLATLSAVVTTTVVHGGVAPNARVFLNPANNAAGVLAVSRGWAVTGISGNDFTIAMPNGVAAAGGETYHYQIVQ